MTDKYSREQRRYDRARIKIKRKNHWGFGYNNWRGVKMPKIQAGIVVNTPTPCSCWMCGNPRKSWVENVLTIQERRAVDDYSDQLKEIYQWQNEGKNV